MKLEDIIAPYSMILLDLWGVVHDGTQLLPGVHAALSYAKSKGKRVVLFSNSPRSAASGISRLTQFGLSTDLYDGFITSGEQCRLELMAERFTTAGQSFFHIGTTKDESLYTGLPYTKVDDLAVADFLLNTGPFDLYDAIEKYESLLTQALARKLPMISANCDLYAFLGKQRVISAGLIARKYIQMGGRVRSYGKPLAAFYAYALDIIGPVPKGEILAVGDSFDTDIPGAAGFGIDSLFVGSGLHRDYMETPDNQLQAQFGCVPTYRLPGFAVI